jgi:polysaccharide export outer membrane protein
MHRLHTIRRALPALPALLAALAAPPIAARAAAQERVDGAAAVVASAGATRWLRPGDAIRLRIWREPDLSGEFAVDEAGRVVLPRLGPVQVTGITPDSLQRFLVAAYGADLRNPSIEVTALRRVQVLGSVNKPGLYEVEPTMRIADAIALAGGPTPDGKKNRVQLQRDGSVIVADLSGSASIVDAEVRSGDRLFVPQRSWVSRNPGVLIAAVVSATGFIVGSLIR